MAKETKTIKGLEIFETGTWNGDVYELQDLKDMITAAENVGFEAPLKLGHMEDDDTKALLKKEGMPAFGWITNLRIKGTKLLADITDIPKKIAELIEKKAYKRVSAEIYWNFKKGSDTFRRVLKAVSLLGAEIPAITDLKSIEALYERFEIEPKAYDDDGNEYRTYFFDGGGLQLKFKDTVNYRLAEGSMERCGSCRFYLGNPEALAIGGCTLVQGEIAADAICDLYEAREAFQFPGGAGATDGVATTTAEFDEFEFGDDDTGVAILSGKLKNGKFAAHKVKFKKAQWTVAAAKVWLKSKGLKVSDLNESDGFLTFLQRKVEDFTDDGFKRIQIKKRKEDRSYTIEKRGDEYCLIADNGDVLGCHPTEQGAIDQERAIEANASKVSSKADDVHSTTKGQSAQGNVAMDLQKKVEELEEKVAQLTKDNAGLVSDNTRLKKDNEDAKTYSSMILDQKNEIEVLHGRLDDITRSQKEEKIRVFIDEQVRLGKVLPREKQTMVAMLREASDEVKVMFSEDGKEVKLSQRQLIMQNLKNRPQMVHYGEQTVSTATFDDGDPGEAGTKDAREEVHERVKKFQAEHNEPNYKVALDRVLGADKKLMERYAKSAGWGQ